MQSRESEQALYQKISGAINDPGKNTFGLRKKSVSNHLILTFPPEHIHFWSPALDLNLEHHEEGKTTIRALIGPAPAIWTMFMFFYSVAGLAVIGGLVLGYSQYLLGHSTFWLWLVPGGFLLGILVYLFGLLGKAWGKEQSQILKEFLESALGYPLTAES